MFSHSPSSSSEHPLAGSPPEVLATIHVVHRTDLSSPFSEREKGDMINVNDVLGLTHLIAQGNLDPFTLMPLTE